MTENCLILRDIVSKSAIVSIPLLADRVYFFGKGREQIVPLAREVSKVMGWIPEDTNRILLSYFEVGSGEQQTRAINSPGLAPEITPLICGPVSGDYRDVGSMHGFIGVSRGKAEFGDLSGVYPLLKSQPDPEGSLISRIDGDGEQMLIALRGTTNQRYSVSQNSIKLEESVSFKSGDIPIYQIFDKDMLFLGFKEPKLDMSPKQYLDTLVREHQLRNNYGLLAEITPESPVTALLPRPIRVIGGQERFR